MLTFYPTNFCLCCLLLLSFATGGAQDVAFEVPTTNTRSKIQQRVAATDIEVTFNRPSVKGRKIFGGLVPYGQVWRTGSDASTKISFSTPVQINQQTLEAGLYEIFTIPGETDWIVIFQQNKNQWGSYSYNSANDALRINVKPVSLEQPVETFAISFDNVTSRSAELCISWDHIKVSIPFTIDLKATVLPPLEESLKAEGKKPYFRAAMFYFENDLDINRAAELMQLAINENPNHLGMLYRYGLILERKGDITGAITASEKSLAEAQKASKELQDEYVKLNTEFLKRLKQ